MFKKNEKVVLVKMWNSYTAYTQECVVQSWGKKQGTLERIADGKMIQERIYTTKLGTWFTVCKPEDAERVAMEYAVSNYNRKIESLESCINHMGYNQGYAQKELAELKANQPCVMQK